MASYFHDNSTRAGRALQIWQILICKAYNRQIITYGMLADMLGYEGAGAFSQTLDHIARYCQQNILPPLTILVVTEKTGLPGLGLIGVDVNAGRETVFNFDWFRLYPPTPGELKEAFQA